ncbi:MAG: B12-binding domain-containing radical SAM protein [Candidatus Helarchaeota archaeon]
MDILLINPRTESEDRSKKFIREPPNGLLILCAILESAGFDVGFLDWDVHGRSDLKNYLAEDPRIVGITSLTPTHNLAMNILKEVKESSPNVITLYGGPHATFKYAEILRSTNFVDYVLGGEADQTILQFMHKFSNLTNSNSVNVANLAYQRGGKIYYRESYIPVDLDELPLPARHLLDLRNYQVGTILVNRGCSYNCAFCVRQKIFQKVRFRKVPEIVSEMQLLSRLGFRFANLYDNLNISKEYALKLCQKLESSSLDLNWGCELRADRISSSLAKGLKASGCKVIAVGVESGDPRILERVNKIQDLKQVERGIKLAKSEGLAIQAYFIVGLPGETAESFNQTLDYLDNLELEAGIDRVNFFAATPYPGTALYTNPQHYGIRILHENWDLYDNEHLILELDSLGLSELKDNFKHAKEIEKEFL